MKAKRTAKKSFMRRYGSLVLVASMQLYWAGGCASERTRMTDNMNGDELGENPMLAHGDAVERSVALDGLSDAAATGKEATLASARATDAAILDLNKPLGDADVPFAARPLTVQKGGPSLDDNFAARESARERTDLEERRRLALEAENDRILKDASMALANSPKGSALAMKKKHKAPKQDLFLAKAPKLEKKVFVAKRKATPRKPVMLAQASKHVVKRAPAAKVVERWKPEAAPVVVASVTKAPPVAPKVAEKAAIAPMLAAVAPMAVPPVKLDAPKTMSPVGKDKRLASLDLGQAVAKHLGLAFLAGGALLLFFLLLLRRSRKDDELEW